MMMNTPYLEAITMKKNESIVPFGTCGVCLTIKINN